MLIAKTITIVSAMIEPIWEKSFYKWERVMLNSKNCNNINNHSINKK
jgi:hypothetical protein